MLIFANGWHSLPYMSPLPLREGDRGRGFGQQQATFGLELQLPHLPAVQRQRSSIDGPLPLAPSRKGRGDYCFAASLGSSFSTAHQ